MIFYDQSLYQILIFFYLIRINLCSNFNIFVKRDMIFLYFTLLKIKFPKITTKYNVYN
jgi:hypothetical protein